MSDMDYERIQEHLAWIESREAGEALAMIDQLRARVAELEAERDRYKSLAMRLCVDHGDYGGGEVMAEIQSESQRMGLYGGSEE